MVCLTVLLLLSIWIVSNYLLFSCGRWLRSSCICFFLSLVWIISLAFPEVELLGQRVWTFLSVLIHSAKLFSKRIEQFSLFGSSFCFLCVRSSGEKLCLRLHILFNWNHLHFNFAVSYGPFQSLLTMFDHLITGWKIYTGLPVSRLFLPSICFAYFSQINSFANITCLVSLPCSVTCSDYFLWDQVQMPPLLGLENPP